ncbi:hypothetical protein EI94DRAFT_1804517 [Lactarius quietus]|nr:hypothetical protein EI94DRAFT_1804517 [Lactarius quietus]
MSSKSNTNAATAANEKPVKVRRKDAPPLVIEDTLRDLAILPALIVDLVPVLVSSAHTGTHLPATAAACDVTEEVDAINTLLLRSYEFARAATKLRNATITTFRGAVVVLWDERHMAMEKEVLQIFPSKRSPSVTTTPGLTSFRCRVMDFISTTTHDTAIFPYLASALVYVVMASLAANP